MAKTVFLAGLFHETHSFLTERTGLDAFDQSGAGTDRDLRIPGSPMAAAALRLESAGWSCLAGPYLFATPSGIVEEEVIETWCERFRTAWEGKNTEVDAIFLVLHGAMVSPEKEDVEGWIVEWIRQQKGAATTPIFAVLDLHGNITPEFCSRTNGFLAYRENPHRDACQAAERVADMLLRSHAEEASLQANWAGTSLIWNPSGTGTDETPMRDLEAIARKWEDEPGIYGVNVFAGYSYADTYHTGVSFSAITNGAVENDKLDVLFSSLLDMANTHRATGIPGADDQSIWLRALPRYSGKPILVAEASDNIGAGAPGDGTGLLRCLIENEVSGAGLILNDPLNVDRLQGKPENDSVHLQLGGRESPLDPGPVTVEARLIRCFDGTFDLDDPRSHLASMLGRTVRMGPCALIETSGNTILLTSRKTPPFDLGQWRVAGVDPKRFRLIGVKAAVGYRQAYDPIAAAHHTIDTPGPCPFDLTTLPFQNVRRPVFPLDGDNLLQL